MPALTAVSSAARLTLAASLLWILPLAGGAQTTSTTNKKTSTTSAPPPPPPPRPQPRPATPPPAPRPAPQPVRPAPQTMSGPASRPVGMNSPESHPVRGVVTAHPIPAPLPRPVAPGRPEHFDHPDAPFRGPETMHRADPVIAHRLVQPRPAGFRDVRLHDGGFGRVRNDGHLADLRDPRRNFAVHNNFAGGRRVEIARHDERIVLDRGRRSFVEHPYEFRDREFVRRTFVDHGRVYQHFYAPYGFHGVRLAVYTPPRFYTPAFYGYAFHPFPVPVRYIAPPVPAPVVAYSANYYTPPATVAGPPQFLAAFSLQSSLAAGFQAQSANGAAPAPIAAGNAVSPEAQAALTGEVQNELALENSEAAQEAQGQPIDPASSGIARLLADGQPHVFLAGTEVDVVDGNGNECAITEGDLLALDSEPEPDATVATLSVLASKGGTECAKGAFVTVQLSDLQEMQNHLRETIDDGLQQLQTAQGDGTLPAPPAGVTTQATPAAFAAIAPPPDPYAQKVLDKEEKDADKTIQSLQAEVSTPALH